jgi:hypothetical protein
MKPLCHIVTALPLGMRSAAPQNTIEFSADLREFGSEGLDYRCLIFRDDEHMISYQPPAGWICSLVGKHLYLKPHDQNFAAAEIKAVPRPALQPFDEAVTVALVQQVLANVPAGSLDRFVVKQESDPISINNYRSFEVVVSYEALGKTFERSVLFLNTPANQIIFKFTARKDIFDDLYQAFHNSILTWEWH